MEMNNRLEKCFRDECTGNVMRVALAILCIGAVTFLLRFLVALVKEARSLPAALAPSGQRGELIEMTAEVQKRKIPRRTA